MNEYGIQLMEKKLASARANEPSQQDNTTKTYRAQKQYYCNWNNFKLTPEYFIKYIEFNNGFACKGYILKRLTELNKFSKKEVLDWMESMHAYFRDNREYGIISCTIYKRVMFLMPDFKNKFPQYYKNNKMWKLYHRGDWQYTRHYITKKSTKKATTNPIKSKQPTAKKDVVVSVQDTKIEHISPKATEMRERKRGTFESLLSRLGEHLDNSSTVVKTVCKQLLTHF